MRKFKLILAVIAIMAILVPVFAVSADTVTYNWLGNAASTWGHGNTMKFAMSDGYYAFCVDKTVVIKTSIKYIALSLEDGVSQNIIQNAGKIRAILNYSWDKTSKNEITAIQYALWHTINAADVLPSQVQSGAGLDDYILIKAIYDKLLDDVQTPPIPAADASINNMFTLGAPAMPTLALGGVPADYSFDFTATSSTGAAITFKVKDAANNELLPAAYAIVDNGAGFYTLTLKGIGTPASYTLEATTLKNKSVSAVVFVSVGMDGDQQYIDKSLSQTVVGVKLSSDTQTKSFTVNFLPPPPPTTTTEAPPPTTTTTEAPPPTTTTTSVAESTIVVTTTTSPTTTLINLTTETQPQVSATTTTLAPTTTVQQSSVILTTDPIPQTGETGSNNGMIIGFVLLALAGGLTLIVLRSKPVKE